MVRYRENEYALCFDHVDQGISKTSQATAGVFPAEFPERLAERSR